MEVSTEVTHDDREIEFHDLLADAKAAFPGGDMGSWSCEMMARELGRTLVGKYRRPFTVSVLEDNEVGAVVQVNARI